MNKEESYRESCIYNYILKRYSLSSPASPDKSNNHNKYR